jgi:hypothetical protein
MDALDKLRDAALEAAKAGFYGDYIVAVVHTVLIKNNVTMNPGEDSQK